MAARYWRLLFLSELALATAFAMRVGVAFKLPLGLAVLAGLGVLLLLPGALAGLSFVIAGVMGPPQRGRGTFIDLLRAWVSESVALQRATLAMSLEPWRRFDYDSPPGAPQPPKPVLLIHGIVCSRAVWRPLANALRGQEFGPIRAVNLEPLLGNIDSHAKSVATVIRQLRCKCGGARVTIIAHSMGGLVARAALRLLEADDIRQIVTLGSPHHGTWLAQLLPGLPYRQMQPDSEWLAALNAAQEGRFPVPVTCIYSTNDNLVTPSRSAALQGATRFELRGLGHLSLLSARPAIDCTLRVLV